MSRKFENIEPGKLTAYERWELPNIGSDNKTNRSVPPKAEKIKPPTAQEIEKIRKEAFEEGKQQGYQAGFAQGKQDGLPIGKEEGFQQGVEQGLVEGQAKIEARLAQLDHLLSELVAPIAKQQSLIEESILNIAMAVARAVIFKELSIDSSGVKKAVESLMNTLPKVDQGFVMTLNPEDQSSVEPVLAKYGSAMQLKFDASLSRGGCTVQSSSQFIDYTIEKRFQKVVQGMLSAAMANTQEHPAQDLPSSINSLTDFPTEVLAEVPETPEEPKTPTQTKLELPASELEHKGPDNTSQPDDDDER